MSRHKPRGLYDFNTDPDKQPIIQQPKKTTKKNRKFDFNQINDDDLQAEVVPNKLENQTQSSMQLNHLSQASQQSNLLPLHSIAKQITNRGNLERQAIAKDPPSSDQPNDTVEDVTFTQDLLAALFQGRFVEELSKLIQQRRFRGFDKQARQRALVFLSFYNFINRRVAIDFGKDDGELSIAEPQGEDGGEIGYLRQWISTMLGSRFVPKEALDLKSLPPKILYFARNKLLSLAKQYQSQQKWTEAFLLANSSDEVAFGYMKDVSSKNELKDQLNIITVNNVKLMKKSAWPVDLGIVLNFYYREEENTGEELIEHLTEIYRRYFLGEDPFLSCQLLAVVLFFEGEGQIVKETDLRKILKAQGRLQEMKLVFLLYLLKPKIDRFGTAIRNVADLLLKSIRDPCVFIHIVEFAQIPLQKLSQVFHILINENVHFGKNGAENMRKLKDFIGENSEEDCSRYWRAMRNWVICSRLLELHQKQQHFGFLQYYLQHSTETQQNIIPQAQIIGALKRTLTNYELACSYKKSKVLEFNQILLRLRHVIYAPLKPIVEGCLAFIEFKQGVFDLRTKLSCLFDLVQEMESSSSDISSSQNSGHRHKQQTFLNYIAKTITRQLKKPDGRIFLYQICQKVPFENRDVLIEQIHKAKENVGRSQQFYLSEIYQLLTITRWEAVLLKQIVIKLVVQ